MVVGQGRTVYLPPGVRRAVGPPSGHWAETPDREHPLVSDLRVRERLAPDADYAPGDRRRSCRRRPFAALSRWVWNCGLEIEPPRMLPPTLAPEIVPDSGNAGPAGDRRPVRWVLWSLKCQEWSVVCCPLVFFSGYLWPFRLPCRPSLSRREGGAVAGASSVAIADPMAGIGMIGTRAGAMTAPTTAGITILRPIKDIGATRPGPIKASVAEAAIGASNTGSGGAVDRGPHAMVQGLRRCRGDGGGPAPA